MIIESSGIRHWECTKCHTVNYEENYLENKLKQELDKAREEGIREALEETNRTLGTNVKYINGEYKVVFRRVSNLVEDK